MPIDDLIHRRKLRVLVLEGSEGDARNYMHELHAAGVVSEWTRVDTESTFLAALDPAPDVILAELGLSDFNGMRALDVLRELGLGTPFLMISSVDVVETAVTAIQQGADDYIVKGRLHSLGPAVVKALDRKRLRDVQKMVKPEVGERDVQNQSAVADFVRMSVAGEIVSGFAHQVNQPLTAIANFADACHEGLKSNPIDVGHQILLAKRILELALRAGEIIRRLQGFARRSNFKRLPIDLKGALEQMLTFAENDALLNKVQLDTLFPASVPTVVGDSILIQQLLLNLVRYAIEAQRNQTDAPRQVRVEVAVTVSNTVKIIVSDNRNADHVDDCERLFSPSFTTKQNGIGLGLPIGRSIAHAHQGTLFAEKHPVRGMAFHLTLPAEGTIR